MNPRDFTFWLHGYFELSNSNNLSAGQVQEIRNHLDLVFNRNILSFKLSQYPDPLRQTNIERASAGLPPLYC
jgi:hypothetical protein